jgi:uncharacterized protein (TIGR02284 family)
LNDFVGREKTIPAMILYTVESASHHLGGRRKRSGLIMPFLRVRFFTQTQQKNFMEKVANILNDLIRINHDRVVGYEKAIDELKDTDADLKALFQRYITESRQYAHELTQEVSRLGADPADGTTNSGKIYRVWMDLKAAIAGKDRKVILENCEFGEDAAQKAYDMALNSEVELEPSLRDLIVRQKAVLKTGHDEVKRLRDLQAANK